MSTWLAQMDDLSATAPSSFPSSGTLKKKKKKLFKFKKFRRSKKGHSLDIPEPVITKHSEEGEIAGRHYWEMKC